MLCGSDSRQFGASGEDGGVLGEAVGILGGRVHVGRVRFRANVLGANVAVVNHLVGESEIGADVARAREEAASQELCDHGSVDKSQKAGLVRRVVPMMKVVMRRSVRRKRVSGTGA